MGEALWSLKAALRRLWADHVIWTRQYVVAAVGDTPDAEAAAGRLLGLRIPITSSTPTETGNGSERPTK